MFLESGSKDLFSMNDIEFSMEKRLCDVFEVLPSLAALHGREGRVYSLLEDVTAEAVQVLFGPHGRGCANFPFVGEIKMPYVSMGSINSTHLFGLDELIIFAFYQKNKNVYRRIADIGANIGLHSIFLAKLGYYVEAFEPDSKHREIIDRNTALNAVRERVIVFPHAVSTNEGTLEFVRVLGNTTGNHIAGAKKSPYGELERFSVPTAAFREIIKRVDLVKLDVEGHELAILADTRREDWAAVDAMVEVGSPDNARGIFDHMKSLGVNMFSQKSGWRRVVDLGQMPISHKEGSLFISCRAEMNWV